MSGLPDGDLFTGIVNLGTQNDVVVTYFAIISVIVYSVQKIS